MGRSGDSDDLLTDGLVTRPSADFAARVQARDAILSKWFAAYPETVFPALTPEQILAAVDAIKATGITSDALHAAWARHLLFHVMLEIKQADEEIAADAAA